MGWEEYVARLVPLWYMLLDQATDEAEIHRFLEAHPCLIPGARTPGGNSGHFPHLHAVITKPDLTGVFHRQPDFMWISQHSMTWYIALIEIESPKKVIFREDNVPNASFTQAMDQLNHWHTWFQADGNKATFINKFGIRQDLRGYKQTGHHYILIYGRRDEFENSAERQSHRGSLIRNPDTELMSFDRLMPDGNLSNFMTVRSIGQDRYEAVHIPPTWQLGPITAGVINRIEGLEDAIDACEFLGADRKGFLKSRLDYWREYPRRERKPRDQWRIVERGKIWE